MESAIKTASSPHAADFIKQILKHIGEKERERDPQRITRQKIQENIVIHIQSNVCVRSAFIGFRTRNWVINRNWLCVLYALIVCVAFTAMTGEIPPRYGMESRPSRSNIHLLHPSKTDEIEVLESGAINHHSIPNGIADHSRTNKVSHNKLLFSSLFHNFFT